MVEAYHLVLVGLGCFVLGVVLTVVFLVKIPKFYRKLSEIRCPRLPRCRQKSDRDPSPTEEANDLPYAMTELRFRELEQPQKAHSTATETAERKRYQEFHSESRKNFHKYTPFQANLKHNRTESVPNEGYEYMHITAENNATESDGRRPDENSHYFILEPQTRQPVNSIRRVNDDEELQYYNPNHIYFILTPDSSKLKPIDATKQAPERAPDHVYFVLEKEQQ